MHRRRGSPGASLMIMRLSGQASLRPILCSRFPILTTALERSSPAIGLSIDKKIWRAIEPSHNSPITPNMEC